MKYESLRLEVVDQHLALIAKTTLREVELWRCWTGNKKSTLETIKQIASDDKFALMHFKNEDELIKEFAEIKVMEFPHEKINTESIDISSLSESYVLYASQLL